MGDLRNNHDDDEDKRTYHRTTMMMMKTSMICVVLVYIAAIATSTDVPAACASTLECTDVDESADGNSYTDCPDSLHKGTYFLQNGASSSDSYKKGICASFADDAAYDRTAVSTEEFPGYIGTGKVVITKAATFKVHKASSTVGAIALKRIVCTDANNCADFKYSVCIDCKSLTGKQSFEFENKNGEATEKGSGIDADQKKKFVTKCVDRAFKDDGTDELKAEFECSAEDLAWHQIEMRAF